MPKEMHSLTCGMSRTTMTAFRLFAQAARCRTRNLQLHQHVIGRELAANLNTEYAGRNGLSHRCFSSSEPDRFQASLQETAALDQLIDMMLAAKSQEEVRTLCIALKQADAIVMQAFIFTLRCDGLKSFPQGWVQFRLSHISSLSYFSTALQIWRPNFQRHDYTR